jgi:alpha-beta hydrolase superfamily lysophospholipase
MNELVKIRSGQWELSGVVHPPASTLRRRIGIVLLHENYNSRFGTHRMFVQVAQALAESGFFVLRYDNRGMCDSPGMNEQLAFEDRIADAKAATEFFQTEYRLETIYFWGLCMGAAVAVHTGVQMGRQAPQGMMLCSLLADPRDAALPQTGYGASTARLAEGFSKGNLAKKIMRLFTDSTYRKNVGLFGKALLKRFSTRQPELQLLQKKIGQLAQLLRHYNGPMVLLFGDKDPCWAHFQERVNPDDKLGLAKKAIAPQFVLLEGGDHTFSSMQQTKQMVQWTVEWAEALRDGVKAQIEFSKTGETRGISTTSVAG